MIIISLSTTLTDLIQDAEPFSAKGLNTYNITRGPHKVINLNISLL